MAGEGSGLWQYNYEAKPSKGGGKRRSGGGGGVRLSTDPQSIAARERRHRISNRFKILQSMVPGGTKMDTVSMLEEAIHYVKFLKTQIMFHQSVVSRHGHQLPLQHDPPYLSYSYPTAAPSLPRPALSTQLPPQQPSNGMHPSDRQLLGEVDLPPLPPSLTYLGGEGAQTIFIPSSSL